jgi:hypothetical protein
MWYKILITVFCLVFSLLSLWKKKTNKEKYPTDLDSIEIERRYFRRLRGYFTSILFLMPLVSTWFPEWAETHHWNLFYVAIFFIIFLLILLPKLLDDEIHDQEKKDNHYDRAD